MTADMYKTHPNVISPEIVVDRTDASTSPPLLVLPSCRVSPEWPLEVARTAGLTVAVPYLLRVHIRIQLNVERYATYLVTDVVANVD